MSDNLIRCVHENGKVCFLTKAATENRNFMKKYGIRVEHVEKKDTTAARGPMPGGISHSIETEIKYIAVKPEETNPEAEAEAVDKQVADALAEATKPAKPKQTRKPRTKKPTKK